MARSRPADSARVPIGLWVTGAEAGQLDEVLARPEFAGWTRTEWCQEIIRTALRYYAGNAPAGRPGRARGAGQQPAGARAGPASDPPAESGGPPAAAAAREPAPAVREPAPATREPAPAAPVAGDSLPTVPAADDNVAAPAEPPAQPECRHPAEARDYEHGVCGACGAILWD
jgi:hypothetical protein